MDDLRFDRLARRLGATTGRRAALKGLAAGLLGVGLAGRAEVTLGARCDRNRDCGNNERCCGNRCRDILNDRRHCGGCNNNCRGSGTRICRNGGCYFQCRGAQDGVCDLNACGDLCGCNFLDADNDVCEFIGERCADLRICNNDNQCPVGRICLNDGCCGDAQKRCVRPCNPRIRPAGANGETTLPAANPSPSNRRQP
jgi:hypothetical protein